MDQRCAEGLILLARVIYLGLVVHYNSALISAATDVQTVTPE
jgi:hypothetical protein